MDVLLAQVHRLRTVLHVLAMMHIVWILSPKIVLVSLDGQDTFVSHLLVNVVNSVLIVTVPIYMNVDSA